MKTLKEVSNPDRLRIREMMQSEEWKLLREIGDVILAAGLETCAAAREDHRFHQGCVAGLRDFFGTLDALARAAKEVEEEEQEASALYRPVRTAATGIY